MLALRQQPRESSQNYFGGGNADRVSAGSYSFSGSTLGLMQRTTAATHNYSRTSAGEAIGLRATANHYYLKDHLGSVIGLLDANGGFSGGYSYSPYGEERFTSSNGAVQANNLRYIGEYRDPTGLYKLGARYYDPSQARFTQMDPSGQEPNPYAYASCDPINGKDPSGLMTDCGADLALLLGELAGYAAGTIAAVATAITGVGIPVAIGIILGLAASATAVGYQARQTLNTCGWS